MDNKTILELIKKNLEEINLLVEDLCQGMKYDQVLIEITIAKAKILYQELSLLTPDLYSVIPPIIEEVDEEVVITEDDKNDVDVNAFSYDEIKSISDELEEVTAIPEVDEEEPAVAPELSFDTHEEPAMEEVSAPDLVADILPKPEDEIINDAPEEFVHITVEESELSIDLPDTDKLIDKIIEVKPDDNEKKVFGEKFSKEPSLNDRLSALHSAEPKIKAKHIDSLKLAIGLNDRFLFTRELFNNNSSEFDASIDKLDNMSSFLEVIEFLEQNYKWTKNATSLKFMELVKRRFEI